MMWNALLTCRENDRIMALSDLVMII